MTEPEKQPIEQLEADHTPDAIKQRLEAGPSHSYLRDFIYGAIDGTVTTFAIVAAASGAGFTSGVAIVLGFANVCADGLSMAVSNYLSVKSDRQVVERTRVFLRVSIEPVADQLRLRDRAVAEHGNRCLRVDGRIACKAEARSEQDQQQKERAHA